MGLPSKPMVVGISGCQGSGKTTLSDTLGHLLKKEPYQLNVVHFSLDDVYLTHEEQLALSKKYSQNRLYQHRGQAGSHDIGLLKETLEALIHANEVIQSKRHSVQVPIPAYDKSLYDGQGDRMNREDWKIVNGPFDLVIVEGWMLGFKPLGEEGLQKMYVNAELISKGFTMDDIRVMNEHLKEYESRIYPLFDIFIHLSPIHLEQVYTWRLQQEHHMKHTRGVSGLTDEAVRIFVDSYMPAYELYLPRLDRVGFYSQGYMHEEKKVYEGLVRTDGGYSAPYRHLKMVLDIDRKMVSMERMKETVMIKNKGMSNRLMIGCAFIGILIIGYSRKEKIQSLFRTLSID